MLVISSILPFPGVAGQQQRVANTLKALRGYFHITFLTVVDQKNKTLIENRLIEYVDDVILLPSKYSKNIFTKSFHKIAGLIYSFFTGLKFSNYIIGKLEFSPSRIQKTLSDRYFDIALFEYWHAVDSVSILKKKNILCVLDMHNILWQSYKRHLPSRIFGLNWWTAWAISNYKKREEAAWKQFNGLIAINRAEMDYTIQQVPEKNAMFYTPMGVDISSWSYSWQPKKPQRLAYYGGLSSHHNQVDAFFCYEQIMPGIWNNYPNAELWIVGSSPPDTLKKLSEKDARVIVTGYVEQVQDVLMYMSVVLCPWSGTYGFRSRLIEVMALGVPVIASPQAVYGMEMKNGQGLFLEETPQKMVKACLNLLQNFEFSKSQSLLARKQVENFFSFDSTYKCLAQNLLKFAKQQNEKRIK